MEWYPDRNMTEAEREAATDEACKVFTAWIDSFRPPRR
jgi:hypothetical protein